MEILHKVILQVNIETFGAIWFSEEGQIIIFMKIQGNLLRHGGI